MKFEEVIKEVRGTKTPISQMKSIIMSDQMFINQMKSRGWKVQLMMTKDTSQQESVIAEYEKYLKEKKTLI